MFDIFLHKHGSFHMHTVSISKASEFVPFLFLHKWWAAEKASGFTSYLKRDWICTRCNFLVYLFDDVLYGNGHRLINLHKKRRNKLFLAPRRTMGHNHPRIQINFIHANELLVFSSVHHRQALSQEFQL